jgi:hypothetical protein
MSDEEEQLDKNGKRGECRGTSDEEENDEEVDKRVAKKLKTILNTLDLTPKTLASKKYKVNRILQQSKIVRLSKSWRNLFTFNGANNVANDSDSDTDVEGKSILFQNYLNIFL